MSKEKRGRGRPRDDGLPNKSTQALIEKEQPKPIKADVSIVDVINPVLGKFPKLEPETLLVNEPNVYQDSEAPEGLKHVDISKPVTVTVKEFLNTIYRRF